MNINSFLIKKPDPEKSVSLTILWISVIFAIASMTLEMFEMVKNTSMSFEFFMAAGGLYFGRRWTSAKGSSLGESISKE